MSFRRPGWGTAVLIFCVILVLMPGKAEAFGAGNIPSIAQVEGHNWRHGDIEDMLKTITYLHGKKWTSLLVSRVYFGNWLRDYSQAVDTAALKGVNAETIRILVWVLSFLSHGYATEEFEVTAERLGTYRPEEHIDNPLGYFEGKDARTVDPRLRGPVEPRETEIDMRTGMKNYIANEQGGYATSSGYLRFSLGRSIHFGRTYLHGSSGKGKETDLCEALRCLGQALHTLEDFSAHSNYIELALRELGHHQVFAHCGSETEINLNGKRVFPLVTGTFGGVDFLHSVLGEANDHFTQSEVDELDIALKNAESGSGKRSGGGDGSRGLFGLSDNTTMDFISLVGNLPGIGGGLASEARDLQAASAAQAEQNTRSGGDGTRASGNVNVVPGMSPDFDPVKTAARIYPILVFRDKIVRNISSAINKIPGMEKLIEHISETLTAFIMGLLAPFIRPIIKAVTKTLKDGSSGVIASSANAQLEPWKNPRCSDPTHSMLSKDHFTNILNSCAGRIAATILQYTVPRILYAWENPGVPVDEVVNDVLRAFHHPAIRDERVTIQKDMFNTVRQWANETPHRHNLDHLLSSESVRNHKNHILHKGSSGSRSGEGHSHSHSGLGDMLSSAGGHGKMSSGLWSALQTRDLSDMSSGPQGREYGGPSSSGVGGYQGGGGAASGYSGGASDSYTGGGAAASYLNQSSGGPPQPPVSPGYGYGQNQGYQAPQGGYSGQQPPQNYGQYQGGGGGYPGQGYQGSQQGGGYPGQGYQQGGSASGYYNQQQPPQQGYGQQPPNQGWGGPRY